MQYIFCFLLTISKKMMKKSRHGILYNSSTSQICQSLSFHKTGVFLSIFLATIHNINALNKDKMALNVQISGNNATIYIRSLTFKYSTNPSTIWHKSSTSNARTLAQDSMSEEKQPHQKNNLMKTIVFKCWLLTKEEMVHKRGGRIYCKYSRNTGKEFSMQ